MDAKHTPPDPVSNVDRPFKRIRIVFLVSLAIQKFRVLQFEAFKKSLPYQFDRQAALTEVQDYFREKSVTANQAWLLANYIRKFNFSFKDVSSTFAVSLACHAIKSGFKFLILALKFLIRNSKGKKCPIKIGLMKMLYKSGACEKEEVARIVDQVLVHYVDDMDQSEKEDDPKNYKELLSIVLDKPTLTPEVRSFFNQKLAETNVKPDQDGFNNNDDKSSFNQSYVPRSFKKNVHAITKTAQVVRARQQTTIQSEEEEEAKGTDLLKKAVRNRVTVKDDSFDEKSSSGSDGWFLYSTWPQVLGIYTKCWVEDNLLKDDDKNSYIPDKFLGRHYLPDTMPKHVKFWSFFINRMCASLFLKASRKQKLGEKAIDSLFQCIVDFDTLLRHLNLHTIVNGNEFKWYGSLCKDNGEPYKQNNHVFVKYFVSTIMMDNYEYFKGYKKPDIVTKFINELSNRAVEEYKIKRWWWFDTTGFREKSSYDKGSLETYIVKEINQIRVDAIKAICNSAKREKNRTLTKNRLKVLEDYDKLDENGDGSCKEFKNYVKELFKLADSLDHFDYKKMFDRKHNQLKSNFKNMDQKDLDNCLDMMINQVKDFDRAKELFTKDAITTLIDKCLLHFLNDPTKNEISLKILKILEIYLEHEETPKLRLSHLTNLIDAANLCSEQIFKTILTCLLFQVGKMSRDQDEFQVLSQILIQLEDLYISISDENCSSFMTYILSRYLCLNKDLLISNNRVLINISKKLYSTDVLEISDDDFGHERFKIVSDNRHDFSLKMSYIASKIILRSIDNKIKIGTRVLDDLIIFLNDNVQRQQEKQALISVAKCLYLIVKYTSLKIYLGQLVEQIDSATISG